MVQFRFIIITSFEYFKYSRFVFVRYVLAQDSSFICTIHSHILVAMTRNKQNREN